MADYTVKRGDTLSGIAKANGMTLAELLKLNPSYKDNPDMVSIGATIVLGGGAAPGSTPATDYTDDDTTRFNGLPGNPEIWKDTSTGTVYVVYYPEGMDPPVPLRYVVNSEEVLKTYFGNKDVAYDKELSPGEMDALGAVTFGDVGEIEDTTGDPWSGFTIKMEKAKEAMPWLEDPGVFAVIASAYLEGRSPEAYEFSHTDWYRTHNDAERAWLTKVAQDPATAAQELEDNRSKVRDQFLSMGIAAPSEEVIDYIAQQWSQGSWSLTERNDQIAAATGGGQGIVIDEELATLIGDESLGDPTSQVDAVRSLWNTWVGGAYPPTDAEVSYWAGVLRDDEVGGTARLTEMLRGQRMSLFPEYEDNTLTWDNIKGPWASMAYNVWGHEAEDTDTEFVDIVKMNDATEAQKDLRRIGLDRGYERVTTAAAGALDRGMATGVRGVA